jgi:predicted RNase H-like nuclease (RuvC/YqgF family)
MRGKLGSGSCNNEVVKGKVVPKETLPKTSPTTRQDKKNMKVEVKTKRFDDIQKVQELKIQVQTLQIHTEELEQMYSRLQNKYQRL